MRLLWLLLLTVGLLAEPTAFQRGREAYGKGASAEAAAAFRQAAGEHPSDGTWHNLGNAEWACGHPGEAILAWERALWLNPHRMDTRFNLRGASQTAQLAPLHLSWYEVASTWLPARTWAWLAMASFWTALGMTLLPGLFGTRKRDGHQALAALGLSAFLLSLPALAGLQARSRIAVVGLRDTPLLLTPTTEGQLLTRLAAGESVRMIRRRGAHILVRTAADLAGWVRAESIRGICQEERTW